MQRSIKDMFPSRKTLTPDKDGDVVMRDSSPESRSSSSEQVTKLVSPDPSKPSLSSNQPAVLYPTLPVLSDTEESLSEKDNREELLKAGAEEAKRLEDVPDEVQEVYTKSYNLLRSLWDDAENAVAAAEVKGKGNDKEAVFQLPPKKKKEIEGFEQEIVSIYREQLKNAFEKEWKEKVQTAGIDAKSTDAQKMQDDMRHEPRWQRIQEDQPWGEEVFPKDTIVGHIYAITKAWRTLKSQKTAEDIDKASERLIQGCLVFQQQLRQKGFDPTRLIPASRKEEFLKIVNSSRKNIELYTEFTDFMSQPPAEEQRIWDLVIPDIEKFLELVASDADEVGKKGTEDLLSGITPYNRKLAMTQKALEGTVSRKIPTTQMEQLLDDEDPKQRSKVFAELASSFQSSGQKRLAVICSEAAKTELDPRTELEPETGSGLSANNESSDVDMKSASNFGANMEGDDGIDLGQDGINVDNDNVIEFDDDDGTIDLPSYEDGITEYGTLEAIRPTYSDQIRFSRFIVNSGTESRPFYRAIKGFDLGPEGARILLEQEDKYTRFNLQERKLSIKKDTKIKKLGPCVELPNTGGAKRKADLYIRLQYSTKSGLEFSEWLCRTEAEKLLGKKFFEKQEPTLLAKYQNRERFFSDCRKRGIHPDTGSPLTKEDKKAMPWLAMI
ncbi:uncharacterized protein EI97DRAFT_224435 [Westerdykella ornata]|uniref:Uncharacterized protein n=1 Tax=Westerdykella ornata TaxID=318751 RepID=A0A6A6JS76_WESOR|nr:uncharacterized protein EI97DRAFT_224435 [Westerdykella ornata]KAF2278963.1 hypothetical protein EI97DRAFT_224435 [Westerdykella ornata]